jgi:RNA polymerase sigma factor (sigma-70 family)
MPDPMIDTIHMQDCVERWQIGDRAAADELIRAVAPRLEHLTRKMLRGFPVVREWNDSADVLQSSLIRFLNTLQKLRPVSTRHFFNLAGVHIRRELLDLARHFSGERLRRLPQAGSAEESDGGGLFDPVDANSQDRDFDLWCRFHEAADQLPTEEREVLGLVFYHGWKQSQIAELLQVDERTVRRRWHSACVQIHQLVGNALPEP